MARLVAATCPRCGAGVRLDPKQQFVTCTYCGVSSFIETPKRPATAEIQRAQPVIHVERVPRSIGCLPGLLSLVVVLVIVGAVSGQLWNGLSLLSGQLPGASSGKPFGLPISIPSSVSFVPTARVEEDLFKDPSLVKRRFEERLGRPVMVKELVLYPTYAFAEAQDPNDKTHLDRYSYRNATVGEPEPVRLSGSDRDLSRVVFSLDQLPFEKLASILQSALTDLALEGGKVTHVILTRDVFSKGKPVIRVYASSARDSGGYVEYDANGKRGRVVH